jgi:hypothetical protein
MPPHDDPDPAAESTSYAYALHAEGHGGRTFTEPTDGSQWYVVEVDGSRVPGACGRPRCLIFVSERVVRRVWEFPDEWYLLADDDLAAVSWGV